MTYDSRIGTGKHIVAVRSNIDQVLDNLRQRQVHHDESKLEEPERSMFDEWQPKLKVLEYGTKEYQDALSQMGKALGHHYAHNSHHPEHYEGGINDMTLFDLVEMLCDWKAAADAHGGDIKQSLDYGSERFNINSVLKRILARTVEELGWI